MWGVGCGFVVVQIRFITMELLDFYDKYRQVGEGAVRQGLAKVREQRKVVRERQGGEGMGELQTEAWEE